MRIRQAVILLAATSASAAKTTVSCFVPEYRVKDGVDFESLGSVCSQIILKGQQIDRDGKYEDVVLNIPRGESLEKIRKAQAANSMKVLIGIGGEEGVLGFAAMIANEEAQKRFIKQTINLLDQHKFDGILVDPLFLRLKSEDSINPIGAPVAWEFKDLAKFLMTLSKALKSKNKMLSMAYQVLYEEHLINGTSKNGKYITDFVDQFVSHAYDSILPADKKSDKQHHSARALPFIAKAFWERSFPKDTLSKVLVGIPFYGRHGERGQVQESYSEIVTGEPAEEDSDYSMGHYFNNIGTVKGKLNFVAASGFGGVNINEVGQDLPMDHEKSLMKAIKDELAAPGFPKKPTSSDYKADRLPANFLHKAKKKDEEATAEASEGATQEVKEDL